MPNRHPASNLDVTVKPTPANRTKKTAKPSPKDTMVSFAEFDESFANYDTAPGVGFPYEEPEPEPEPDPPAGSLLPPAVEVTTQDGQRPAKRPRAVAPEPLPQRENPLHHDPDAAPRTIREHAVKTGLDVADEPEQPEKTLDRMITEAKINAAGRNKVSGIRRCIEILAELGGACEVEDLLDRGVSKDTLAMALQGTGSSDGRSRPRLKLDVTAEDAAVVWLTTTGWQSAGFPSRRETPPSSESIRHARMPKLIAKWCERHAPRTRGMPQIAIRNDPETIKEFSAEAVAAAWSRIQGPLGDNNGMFGPLTGGLMPDALMIERWATTPDGEADWKKAWASSRQPDFQQLAETWIAIEVELSAKGEKPLKHKVKKWDAALDLGLVQGVLWIVDDEKIADRLRSLGVGNLHQTEGQYLAPAHLLDLPGAKPYKTHPSELWWLLAFFPAITQQAP